MDNTNFNLVDKYKYSDWTKDLIKKDLQSKSFPFAVLMEHFIGDFTIASVLRSCNGLNGSKLYYLGGSKKWDKRGSVGVQNYFDIIYLKEREELLKLKKDYTFVALENNVPNTQELYDYKWKDNSLIILGEEGVGITPETLSICDEFITIPMYGSVRSFNAACAGTVAMYDYVNKYQKSVNRS